MEEKTTEQAARAGVRKETIELHAAGVKLHGDLMLPDRATGIVIFAHGSGSSRLSPRNQSVAGSLNDAGLATLLFDLLTREEEQGEETGGHLRFNIDLLSDRLVGVTDWIKNAADTRQLNLGYFGASTGAAAALVAAAKRPGYVRAIVSRGGRPDLAAEMLPRVYAATLLIVGSRDLEVLEMNRVALRNINAAERQLRVIRGAGHLFEEPGTLEQVTRLAEQWFRDNLPVGFD